MARGERPGALPCAKKSTALPVQDTNSLSFWDWNCIIKSSRPINAIKSYKIVMSSLLKKIIKNWKDERFYFSVLYLVGLVLVINKTMQVDLGSSLTIFMKYSVWKPLCSVLNVGVINLHRVCCDFSTDHVWCHLFHVG